MSEWYFVLAPVALLIVLSLVRFVGCGGEDFSLAPEVPKERRPSDVVDYAKLVRDSGAAPYWRLQEQQGAPAAPSVANTPVAGGTAVDTWTLAGLIPGSDGTYKAIKTEPPTVNPPFPLDTPWSPGVLLLGQQPGLLELPGQE